MKLEILSVVLLTFVFGGCTSSVSTKAPGKVKVNADQIDFSGDSAYKYVADQVAFGPRVPGSESSKNCLEYFKSTFERMGLVVEVQDGEAESFDGTMLPIHNVIAKVNPQKANRVMLCSHWDSRAFADQDEDPSYHDKAIDGANDGASGVGVLIEMARQFSIKKPSIGVDIVLFDTEDCGTPEHYTGVGRNKSDTWCLGSQYWAKSDLGKNCDVRFGVLLDMVGAKDALFFQDYYSKSTAQDVLDKVWGAASSIGYGRHFVNDKGGYITDDHYYVSKIAGVPCIDVIQYDPNSKSNFYRHWHTRNDVLDNIDKETLSAVGRTLLYVVYNE